MQLSFSLFRIISFVALFFIIEHYSRNTLLANKDLSLSIIIYIERERDREAERDTQRETERETERQTQRETETGRDRETEREKRITFDAISCIF